MFIGQSISFQTSQIVSMKGWSSSGIRLPIQIQEVDCSYVIFLLQVN